MTQEILNNFQKEVLKYLGKNKFVKNFYWTGGTCLAYFYLRHRRSLDLDFFSGELFNELYYINFAKDLKSSLKLKKIDFKQEQNRFHYLLYKNKKTLKLELVYFPFKNSGRIKTDKEYGIKIDSLQDIMANKVLAAYQRKEPKDIFDLYVYLTKTKKNLSMLLKLVEKKFGVNIELSLFIAKVNGNIKLISDIKPFIFDIENNLIIKIRNFFQGIFNEELKARLK
ncbi:MAG: nucleotidyl transferase AbiEii/AbiGii toxin family protein [Patescibacteria group bacterium]